jgi:ribonuclease HI
LSPKDSEPDHLVEAYVDGACVPKNPGGTPVWGCLFLRDGVPLDVRGGQAASENTERATNSVAEYQAFINALKEVQRLGWSRDKVRVYTDSQFLHGHLAENWKVDPKLQPLHKKAMDLLASFRSIEVQKIDRTKNKVAHRAARAAFNEIVLGRLNKSSKIPAQQD